MWEACSTMLSLAECFLRFVVLQDCHPGNPSIPYESTDTSGHVIKELSCRIPLREKKRERKQKRKMEMPWMATNKNRTYVQAHTHTYKHTHMYMHTYTDTLYTMQEFKNRLVSCLWNWRELLDPEKFRYRRRYYYSVWLIAGLGLAPKALLMVGKCFTTGLSPWFSNPIFDKPTDFLKILIYFHFM